MDWQEQQDALEVGKVYWSDRECIFRKAEGHNYITFIYLHGSSIRFNSSMSRANFTEPTYEELVWFEHCERLEQCIPFKDFKPNTDLHIQLYPLN